MDNLFVQQNRWNPRVCKVSEVEKKYPKRYVTCIFLSPKNPMDSRNSTTAPGGESMSIQSVS